MKTMILASALALAVSAPALANEHWDESKMKEKFEAADTNKDGALSPTEFKTAWPDKADKWAKLDANGDGKVTFEEKKAYKESKHEG
jgi:hypothetical protein